jgi:predicted DNA-binding transcriptional regulator AlpA
MAPRILTKADLKARGIDFNSSTLWRKAKAGKFPRPVKVGNRNGWPDNEIDEYVESLITERDAGAGE